MKRAAHALRTLAVLGVLVAILVPSTMSRAGTQAQPLAAEAVPGPIGHHGRWVTDADGRVLLLHGVNFVAKVDGETPAEMGFGDDDAQFLADNGFDVVRLGLTAGSIMPSPGVIDTAYLASFRQTIDTITDHDLLVLVDLHQDGWGPSLGSDGFPEWMTLTHGAENTHTGFPLYYITNPAIQAAFDSFWGNEAGPENVNIQDRVGTMMAALAQSVGDNPGVLGYDLLNEPWPGTVWQPCATDPAGCPEQDKALDAYNARMARAIRTQDPTRLLLGEPYVLFNFGGAPTNITLPGNDPQSGMSYHLYTADPALEPAVQDFAVQWADNTCGALMNTEFGATTDVGAIDREVNEIDGSLIPWIWWAYNENFAGDMSQPVGATPINEPVVNTLVRPHPRAVAGTPWLHHYDLGTRSMQFTYSTTPVDGGTWPAGTETEFQVASRTYPEGYDARVLGGTITSAPDAEVLTVAANAGSTEVTVLVWPAGQPEPPVVAVSMVAVDDPCATTPDAPITPVADTQPAVEPNFTG